MYIECQCSWHIYSNELILDVLEEAISIHSPARIDYCQNAANHCTCTSGHNNDYPLPIQINVEVLNC